MAKLIRVDGFRDFQCTLGWTAQHAEQRIRSAYPIVAGYIANNGFAADLSHVIEATGDYEFVITQAAPAQTVIAAPGGVGSVSAASAGGSIRCHVTINAVPVEPMDFPLPVTPVDILERIVQSAGDLLSFSIKRVFGTVGGFNIKKQIDDMERDLPIGNYLIECVSADSVIDKVLSDEVKSTKSQSSTGTVNLNKVLSNITNENLVRVLFRVTTRSVPLGLCQGGVVGYFHSALNTVIQHGVVQRTTVDEIQISVEGTRDTIYAVHEELRKLKNAHFARDPKMLWSLEVKVIDPNCLRYRYFLSSSQDIVAKGLVECI